MNKLNSLKIQKSFQQKYNNLSKDILNQIEMISDAISDFDIKDLFVEYNNSNNVIRIDVIVDNNFMLLIRKKLNQNNVSFSLSKNNETYIADYLNLNEMINIVKMEIFNETIFKVSKKNT